MSDVDCSGVDPAGSYKVLMQQARSIEMQADELLHKERDAAILEIREKAAAFGLGAEDIFGGRRPGLVAPKAAPVIVRFRCPDSGATWSGRGRRPQWVVEVLRAGKSLDLFKV